MFEVTCIFCHFSTIRFSGPQAYSDLSLRSCIYTVTFREINILWTLLKGFLGKRRSQNFGNPFVDNYRTNLSKNPEKHL